MPAIQHSQAGGGGGVTQTVLDAATDEVIALLRAGAPVGEDTFDEVSDILGTLTTAVAGKQPSDTDLAAIALLGTTSYGRAVLELADAASGRTYLGLGSAATASSAAFDAAGAAAAAQAASQPVDSDLTAVAALSTTSYGRGVLALADASALRSTAGLVLGTDVYAKSAVDSGFAPLAFPTVKVTRSAALTITTATETTISWDAEEFDPNGYHAAGDPTKLTVPSGMGGLHLVGLDAAISTPVDNVNERMILRIYKNGTEVAGGRYEGTGSGANTEPNGCVVVPLSLAAGDVLTATIFHQRGSDGTFRNGASGSAFWLVKLGSNPS